MPALKQKRICAFGHTYYKSSDCPVCPECERLSKPESGFLTAVPAPARRALQRKGIGSLNQLAEFSKKRDRCTPRHGTQGASNFGESAQCVTLKL